MPRINLGEGLGQATPTPQGGVPSVAGLDQSARAMQGFLQAGAETILEFDRNRVNMEAKKATTEAMKEIEDKKLEFSLQDNDFATQPQRYQEFYNDLESRYKQQITDPRAFQQFQESVSPFAFNKGMDIKSNAIKQNAAAQQATLESTLSDISSLSLRGDAEQFEQSVAEGEALIDEAFEIGVLDTREAEQFRANFKNGLSRGKVRQDINYNPQQALDNIKANKYANLSAEEQSQFESMALSKIAQNRQRASVEANKQAKELVDDALLSWKNGYIVSDEENAAVNAAAQLIGKTEEVAVARNAAQYATLPKNVRDGLREELAAEGGLGNAEQRVALETADEAIQRSLDDDGYQFAVDQRIVEFAPININDPSTVQARLDQMDYLKAHYGQEVSPLTNQEADSLVQTLPMMSPQAKTQLAQAFGDSQAIWSQLDKKNAGTFAMAGATGDPAVMENIFKGQQLKADKLVPSISAKDYLPAFNDFVDDIYVGQDRTQMLNAALNYYYATTKEDTFNTDDFEAAIEAVSGGIGKINGFKLELPRGVPENDFKDFIDDMSPETVQEFGGVWSMSDAQALEVIKDAHIISDGSNRYRVIKDGSQLMRNDGQPFTFSFDEETFRRDKVLKESSRPTRQELRSIR